MVLKTAQLIIVVLSVTASTLAAQSTQKLAEINAKIIGRWVTADRKSYIEFYANGKCDTGSLWKDGQWHIDHSTLSGWEQGEDFSCGNGILSLVAPNKMSQDYGMGGEVTLFYRGAANVPKTPQALTLLAATTALRQHIDEATIRNMIFTCHACYNPSDKEDNDGAPIVSTYSEDLTNFLIAEGYIQILNGKQVFTSRAKRSRDYGDGGFGLRIAHLRNPRVLGTSIPDPRNVSIEYDLVPTEITAPFFGKTQRVRTSASFQYRNEHWEVCVGCS